MSIVAVHGPNMLDDPPEPEEPEGFQALAAGDQDEGGEGYDPGAHNISDVQEYVNEHDSVDEIKSVLAAERAGQGRVTLISYLESLLPYDPGEHTIADVQQYVTDHPDQLDAVFAAESEGKNRVTLVAWLEDQAAPTSSA